MMTCTKDSRFMTLAEVGRDKYTVNLAAGSLAGSEDKTIQIVLDATNKIKGAVDNYQITLNGVTYLGSTISTNIASGLDLRLEVGYNDQNQLIAYIWLYNTGINTVNYSAQRFDIDVCYFMPPESAK